jgi:Uma2 family endonuclease
MAMPAYSLPERLWTFAQLEQLPEGDGNRYEILDGELLVAPMPSTGHQGIAARLTLLLGNWCRSHTGWLFLAPGGVYIGETSWLEPDVAVYRAPEYESRRWQELPPPLLVVEVLSPSNGSQDRHRKRAAYLANGVGEVWTIDPETRTIEVWTSASEFPQTFVDFVAWVPDENLPPLTVTADELFGPRTP